MTSLGVWACQYRELRPISFGGTGASRQTEQNQIESSGENEDELAGYARGRGRGRNRDGGGSYEMVGMKEDAAEAV